MARFSICLVFPLLSDCRRHPGSGTNSTDRLSGHWLACCWKIDWPNPSSLLLLVCSCVLLRKEDHESEETEAQISRMAAGLIGSSGSRSFWPVGIQHTASPPPAGSGEMNSIDELVSAMDCDQSVTRVKGTTGGSSVGYRRWKRYGFGYESMFFENI